MHLTANQSALCGCLRPYREVGIFTDRQATLLLRFQPVAKNHVNFLQMTHTSRPILKHKWLRIMLSRNKTLVLLAVLALPNLAGAVEYTCTVTKKWELHEAYTEERLSKWSFTVKIEEYSDSAFLSRCSFSTFANESTCDRYEVDRIEFDKNPGIKKYYVFASHFDVQLFSDLTMLENNGRGTLATGICQVTSP